MRTMSDGLLQNDTLRKCWSMCGTKHRFIHDDPSLANFVIRRKHTPNQEFRSAKRSFQKILPFIMVTINGPHP